MNDLFKWIETNRINREIFRCKFAIAMARLSIAEGTGDKERSELEIARWQEKISHLENERNKINEQQTEDRT
jgi:hypothetical protein